MSFSCSVTSHQPLNQIQGLYLGQRDPTKTGPNSSATTLSLGHFAQPHEPSCCSINAWSTPHLAQNALPPISARLAPLVPLVSSQISPDQRGFRYQQQPWYSLFPLTHFIIFFVTLSQLYLIVICLSSIPHQIVSSRGKDFIYFIGFCIPSACYIVCAQQILVE